MTCRVKGMQESHHNKKEKKSLSRAPDKVDEIAQGLVQVSLNKALKRVTGSVCQKEGKTINWPYSYPQLPFFSRKGFHALVS